MSHSKPWQIDGSYIPRRLVMLQSPAWRAAPRTMKALLEILEVEHMRHKGCANGELARSYTQFIADGFNRHTVTEMTRIAEALGFLRINRESGIGKPDLRDASLYTLTYLPTGVGRNIAPTDDWRRITSEEQAERIIERVRETRRKSPSKARKAA